MDIVVPRPSPRHFTAPNEALAGVGASEAAALLAAAADVALVIDAGGIIRDMAFGSDEMLQEGFGDWIGRAFVDTVARDSRTKVEQLLREATAAPSRWRQINHPTAAGQQVPVRYSVVRIGRDGRMFAIGRDLRALSNLQQRLADAQQAMEREYARIRGAETRYRLLFQLAGEPILVLDANSTRVVECNPAAGRLLSRDPRRIAGQTLTELFARASSGAVQSAVAAVRVTGRVEDARVALADGTDLRMSASLFRQDGGSQILVRVAAPTSTGETMPAASSGLLRAIEAMPEGFVVTDPERRILTANAAFLDLAQLATAEQARGEPLDRWLGRGADLDTLFASLAKHGSVRHFATLLRGEYGSSEDVEITGVSVPDGDTPCSGFSVRPTALRSVPTSSGRQLPRSVEQFTELVGRVPLKNLVRETTDMIERLCIEAALELTRDNRASAAEMLGLSRQSLYAKLRRYGLGDLDPVEDLPEE